MVADSGWAAGLNVWGVSSKPTKGLLCIVKYSVGPSARIRVFRRNVAKTFIEKFLFSKKHNEFMKLYN